MSGRVPSGSKLTSSFHRKTVQVWGKRKSPDFCHHQFYRGAHLLLSYIFNQRYQVTKHKVWQLVPTNSIFSGNIHSLLSCSIGRGQPCLVEMTLSGEKEAEEEEWGIAWKPKIVFARTTGKPMANINWSKIKRRCNKLGVTLGQETRFQRSQREGRQNLLLLSVYWPDWRLEICIAQKCN